MLGHFVSVSGEGVYLTVYPKLSANTEIYHLMIISLMIPSLISMTISPYTSLGVYCEIYPSLEGNTEKFKFNIPLLKMIFFYIFAIILINLNDLQYVFVIMLYNTTIVTSQIYVQFGVLNMNNKVIWSIIPFLLSIQLSPNLVPNNKSSVSM